MLAYNIGFFDLSLAVFLIIIGAAFCAGTLHGATGMAGGIIMAAILSHILGIKEAIPVISCALVLSHASRVVLFWKDTDWSTCRLVLTFGTPTILLGAYIFSFLSPRVIAAVFALFLIASFPIKYWARKHNIKVGRKLLAGASVVWGMLAGNVIGPGFFLAPFLLGTGMNRLTFVGSLAVITLMMNLIKLPVFGFTNLLDIRLLSLGIIIGIIKSQVIGWDGIFSSALVIKNIIILLMQ